MRFALAFVGVALLAGRVQARQGERKRVEAAAAKLQVRVVRPGRTAAPKDVEVRVVAAGEVGEKEPLRSEAIERERLTTALARAHAFANPRDGSIEVSRPPGSLLVVASAPGLYVERAVDADDAGPVELELREDRSLAVRVVDESGRPVARVPVAIANFGTWGAIPDLAAEREVSFRALATTRERDGVALFEHVQEWIDPDRYDDAVALLAVPHADHEQVRISPTILADGTVDLHAPRFGSVELRLPGVSGATVRLRERPAAPPPDGDFEHHVGLGEWRRHEPLELELVDGVARCDRIGVGCRLEIEARWNGLLTPFCAEFTGPERAGAGVAWSLLDGGAAVASITTALTGRVVDGRRQPFASRVLRGRIVAWRDGYDERSRPDDEFGLVTDAAGRFELLLGPRAPAAGTKWWLAVHEFAGDDDAARRGARGWIDVTGRLGAGARDLGDALLVGADGKSRVERAGDDELVGECAAARFWPDPVESRAATVDLRLNEMARRGGPRVVSFLELEIARQRDEATRAHDVEVAARADARAHAKATRPADEGNGNDGNGDDDDAESEADREAAIAAQDAADAAWRFAVDLKWAALLRRAQRKPPPIVFEPVEPVAEATTPETPRVAVRIHVVDEGFEGLFVPRLDEGFWRTTVLDHAGNVVPDRRDEPWFGVGGPRIGNPTSALQNDDSYVEVVPIGRQFEDARPGDYRVRVDFMVGDVAAVTSGDLAVRIRPVPIRVTRRDYAAMVAAIRAIDVSKPVPLTQAAIDSRDQFSGDPETPEDRIARSGLLALPALLDELDETTDDPRRRAWILGLLWDTHQAKSIRDESIEAAVGPCEWSYRWPTVLPKGDEAAGGSLNPGHHEINVRVDDTRARAAAPDVAVQRDLAAAWTDLRAWFEITVEK